jgi:HlyD family secretion protein
VKLGQQADVISDTYPDRRYSGRVVEIAEQPEFTPKNVQTREERVKLVFGVKIEVANPNRELKPGMPADAVIRVGP